MKTLVVVPVFNREESVIETLTSVATQTHLPDLLVVVDDGSSDSSLKLVNEWLIRNPHLGVRVEATDNQGAARARNLAFEKYADGMELVAFLDSDDLWPDDFLDRARSALELNPTAIAASTDRLFIPLLAPGEAPNLSSLHELPSDPWGWMIQHGAGIGSCTVFRASAFKTAKCYPEEFPTGHDTVIFGRVAQLGSWCHLPGKPTIFARFKGQDGGIGWHLHERYIDYPVWWAKASHVLWQEAPRHVRFKIRSRIALSRRWLLASINAVNRRQYGEALGWTRAALFLNPFVFIFLFRPISIRPKDI